MTALTLRGRLILGSEIASGSIVVEDGVIAAIERDGSGGAGEGLDGAPLIAPGLIDLQVNGGFGVEVGNDPDAICLLSARLPATGVTGFLPTLVSLPAEACLTAIDAFHRAQPPLGARPLGLHIEGPFISVERKGAHSPDAIGHADLEALLAAWDDPAIRIVTLAPERRGSLQAIETLRRRGVTVSLGHTNASYEEMARGVDAGATMATHLYNAMSPLNHRAPGAVGAALVDDRVTVGVIPDGIHSHPASLRLALLAKGHERIVLVTDMMAAAGMGPGTYPLGGRPVHVDGESAKLPSGTLAGSIATMDQAVRNMVRWSGASLPQAVAMSSAVPARLLGLPSAGSLAAGFAADLVVFDAQLNVMATYVAGEEVYRRP